MADQHEHDEWDEWGEEDAQKEAPVIEPPPQSNEHVHVDTAHATATAIEPEATENEPSEATTSTREPMDWAWDFNEIDADLKALAPSTAWPIPQPTSATDSDAAIIRLASVAEPARVRMEEVKSHTQAIQSLANVVKWNLTRLDQSLQTHQGQHVTDDQTLAVIEQELRNAAGEWAYVDTTAYSEEVHQQLHEMSGLLQRSLSACDEEDVSPFQQALEQLFASQPNCTLEVPITWIRPTTSSAVTTTASQSFNTYLQRLVELCGNELPGSWCVPVLSEAETFQDTKDIQRDEVVVNGDFMTGTIGYEAIIGAIENHIVKTATAYTASSEKLDMAAVRQVAQQVLHAINRTESGGGSYEILSQFVSNHSMEVVLIRPASAKAPPLQIQMDVGPFFTQHDTWSFGLRVVVSAVTWYCICDASDPTHEYYEIKTNYTSRLGFPLGLAPLSTAKFMRHDVGTVQIAVSLNDEPAPSADIAASTTQVYGAEEDADFDAIM